jgi:cellulose biosynthesis protein BcsQ
MGKIIATYSPKGGVGKTSLSMALAEYLAYVLKLPTLLIDLDGQRTLSGLYGLIDNDKGTILDVLEGRKTLRQVTHEIDENLHVVAASPDLFDWRYNEAGVLAVAQALKAATAWTVIIDCGPSYTDLSKAALVASNAVLPIYQPAPNDVQALQDFIERLAKLRAQGVRLEMPGVVLNRIISRAGLHREAKEMILGAGYPIIGEISDSIDIQYAARRGCSLIRYRRNHKAGQECMDFAARVTECLGIA